MILQRFEVPGLAHYSYIVAGNGEAAVVDPKRDFDTYLDYAAANSLKITRILETHIHADYASGALELARATGAELWLSKYDTGEDFEYAFPHREFGDGKRCGSAIFPSRRCLPPVTRRSTSRLWCRPQPGPPPGLFPAIFSLSARWAGRTCSASTPNAAWPRALREHEEAHCCAARRRRGFPAHGAGSLCGSGMSSRPVHVGYERLANVFFAHNDREKFIEHILNTVPPFPEYYKRMKRVNSAGPKLLGGIPGGEALSPSLPRADREAGSHRDRPAPAGSLRRRAHPRRAQCRRRPDVPHVGRVGGALRPAAAAGRRRRTDYESARRALFAWDSTMSAARLPAACALDRSRLREAHLPQALWRSCASGLPRRFPARCAHRRGVELGPRRRRAALMGGYLADRMGELPKDKPIYVMWHRLPLQHFRERCAAPASATWSTSPAAWRPGSSRSSRLFRKGAAAPLLRLSRSFC